MEEFVQATVLGLVTASIFAVAATGLVLTYTTTGIFNFAHGALGMLGAFTYWQLRFDWGWPAPLALLAVLGVLAPLLGVVIEVGIMRGLSDAPETVRVVVTISLLVALIGLGFWVWSPDQSRSADPFWGRQSTVDLLGVRLNYHEIAAVVLAVALAVGLRLLLYRTRPGIAMRAAVDSRPLATLNAARPDRSAMLAWGIGVSLAALSGILIAPVTTGMDHLTLTLLVVNAYAAAMIGRLRSLPMTYVGAIVLGLADSYAITYLRSDNGVVEAMQRRVDEWGWIQTEVAGLVANLRFALPAILLGAVLLALRQPKLRAHGVQRSREFIPRPPWIGALATAAAFVGAGVYMATVVLSYSDALDVAKIVGIAIIGLSLVPLVGYAGQLSLCQMSFAGIGAVVMAHHGQGGNPTALLYAALITGVVGALVALPALRLGGLYLALATAAFAAVLDKWIFKLDEFELGPWTIKLFPQGEAAAAPVNLDRLSVFGHHIDLPFIDGPFQSDGLLMFMSMVFAVLFLFVVGIRRSRYGQRLLAMKDSPAAAATIGMNLTLLKLSVFTLSAAMAGVGGALFAGTFGTAADAGSQPGAIFSGGVDPAQFDFLQSLPLLLLGVVGGIGSAAGALVAGLMLGGTPMLYDMWPWLQDLNRVMPGMMGIALGRNPNGIVHDLRVAFEPVRRAPALLIAELVAIAAVLCLRWAELVSGGGFAILLLAAVLLGPALNALVKALSTTRAEPGLAGESGSAVVPAEIPADQIPWEQVGLDRPFQPTDADKLERALGVDLTRSGAS